jgi:hypothetical protein
LVSRYGSELRVDRVLGFSPVVGIGIPPPTHPQAIVSPSSFGSGEGSGDGRGPNSDEGQTLWYSRYICTLSHTVSIRGLAIKEKTTFSMIFSDLMEDLIRPNTRITARPIKNVSSMIVFLL